MILNLMNNRITVGQILSNPKAKKLAFQNIPALRNPGTRRMVWNMQLWQVIRMARKRIPEHKIQELLHKLREI